MDDQQRARELLAQEYERDGITHVPDCIRREAMLTEMEHRAIRAITAALRAAPEGFVMADRAQLGVALEAVRTAMEDAFHRRFPECCGSYSPSGCCGNFREAWNKEDQQTMDALQPAEQALTAMLAARPQGVKDET